MIVPWLSLLQLAGAGAAAALWYLAPQLGPWPLLLGLGPWLVRLAVERRLPALTPFFLPLLLFLITAAAGVWAAFDRAPAWARFWQIVAGLLLFYAFAHGMQSGDPRNSRSRARFYGWLPALLGATLAVYFVFTNDWDRFPSKIALLERLGREVQSLLPPVPGHRLNPNVAGGILAWSAPFAMAMVFSTARSLRKQPARDGIRQSPRVKSGLSLPDPLALAAGAAMLALILFGLLMTTSRGAWLGLGAAMGAGVLWFFSGWLSPAKGGGQSSLAPARQHRRTMFAIFTALVLLAGLALVAVTPQTVIAVLDQLPGPGGLRRVDLYRNSLTLALDYPIVGAGLDNFMMLYSTYAFLLHVGYAIHSHNLYLDVAVQQGGLALAALLWMALLFLAALWHSSRKGRLPTLLAAAGLSAVTVAVHGLVDDAFYGSRAVVLLFLPLSFVFAQAAPGGDAPPGKWLRHINYLFTFLLVAVAILFWLTAPARAVAHANLGAVLQSRQELSVYEWPEWRLQDEVRRAHLPYDAIAHYETALSLDPENATANRRLGQIELSLGEYEDALAHLRRAYAATPWDNATRQLLGEALILNGDVEQGAALWREVNNAQNQLAARTFWYGHVGEMERQQRIQAVVEALPDRR